MSEKTVVVFDVGYTASMSSGTTIPFNRIKTNIGNGWNRYYHRFTAPVKGLYYFTLSIITPIRLSQSFAGAHIMRGNVHLRHLYALRSNSIQTRQPASGSAAVMLNAGEQILG